MNEIRLQNFRCYADQSIELKPGINLLVGDNASGKTSVLKACKYVLSAFFAGFSDENTKWINPDIDNFRHVELDGILSQELPIQISFNAGDMPFYDIIEGSLIPINCNMDRWYTLNKNSKKNSHPLTSGIKEYKDYATLLKENYTNEQGQQQALPLFANFSTEDIHSNRKIDAGKFKTYNHKPSFGYYECLEGDGFLPYWIKRLLILQEGERNKQEITIVRKAISDALGVDGCNIIQDLHIRPLQKKVYYRFMDGREVEADFLSDGYRRIPIITYGMDLSTISDIILDQTPRAAEVDKQLNNLFSLIDAEKYKDARQMLHGMQEKYNNQLPELSQAEAMLNCITTDDNEENQ